MRTIAILLLSTVCWASDAPKLNGFQKAEWGMSEQQFKKIYPGTTVLKNGFLLKTEVAGEKSEVAFFFKDKKLNQVVVMFSEKFMNNNLYYDRYLKVRELLIKKYGEPIDTRENWSSELFKDKPDQVGTALVMQHVTFGTRWKVDKTEITLGCNAANMQVNVGLLYVPIASKATDAKEQEKKALDSL